MSFKANASPILAEVVSALAPESIGAPCPCEVVPEKTQDLIRLTVARRLFGKNFRFPSDLDRFLSVKTRLLSDGRKLLLAQELLPFDGIGDDSFFLNEWFADDGPKLSGFDTLLAWDEYTHRVQEGYWDEQGERSDGMRPYVGRLLWDWSRWLEDGRMVYGNLSVAHCYLRAQLDELAGELATARYPTRWYEGPEHGKTDGLCTQWDMREDPAINGELRSAAEYLAHLVMVHLCDGQSMRSRIGQSGPWVMRIRTEEDGEISEDLVFSCPEAMGKARFAHWVSDLKALPDGAGAYREIEAELKVGLTDLMNDVFLVLEEAVSGVSGPKKGDWKGLCRAAATALAAKHPVLADKF